MTQGGTRAIVLLQLGGPDSPEAIAPFLENLFSDPFTIPLPFWLEPFRAPLARLIATRRAPKVQAFYAHMGGRSPLLANTRAQADALAAELVGRGQPASVHVAMRAWHPLTESVVSSLLVEDPDDILLLPLYPQESSATVGSSVTRFQEVAAQKRLRGRITVMPPYYADPGYITAIAETVREALARFERADDVAILFSAHSLPMVIVKKQDPYPAHIAATRAALEQELALPNRTYLAFQSQTGGVKWLGPTVHQGVDEIAASGLRKIVMVPLGFVSDHLETLYEMDVLYGQMVRARGFEFVRAAALGDRPAFIRALADLCVQHAS